MGRTPSSGLETGGARRVLAVVSAVVLLAGFAALVRRADRTDADVDTARATTAMTAPGSETPEPVDPSATSPQSTAVEPAPAGEEPAAAPPAAEPTATTTPGAAPADPAQTLRDRTFESVSVTEEGSGERTFVEGGTLTVHFEAATDGDVIRWRISCNTAGGRVTISADRLTVGEVGSSAVGCGPEKEAEDTWIASFFDSSPGWTLDGTRLTLRSEGTVIVLDEVPAA